MVMIFKELRNWIFVCTGPVNRRHRHIQPPQINRELSARVICVIHEDQAKKPDPRGGRQQKLSVFPKGPGGRKPSVVHVFQSVLRTFNALRELVHDFLAILGLEPREVRDFRDVLQSQCRKVAGCSCNVQRQFAQGKRSRVRPPCKLVFRNSFQDAFCGLGSLVELPQNRIRNSHDICYFDLACVAILLAAISDRTFTRSVVNTPVDSTLPTIKPAPAMHAGHISCFPFPAAAYCGRAASARPAIRVMMCFQPCTTPCLCSSVISPSAV